VQPVFVHRAAFGRGRQPRKGLRRLAWGRATLFSESNQFPSDRVNALSVPCDLARLTAVVSSVDRSRPVWILFSRVATPKGDVEQCVGRIQRPHAQKQPPLVVDLVDPSPVFEGMARRRMGFYRSQGYAVRS
jgi:hypothetical protein